MASLIVSVLLTWCVHRHVSHRHSFWFKKFAKSVIAYLMAFVNGFGVLKARGSWQAFVEPKASARVDVPRALEHTSIREEFLALPQESGNLVLPRALSVGCSICKARGSHYSKAAEWCDRRAVEAQLATDFQFDCSRGAGDKLCVTLGTHCQSLWTMLWPSTLSSTT